MTETHTSQELSKKLAERLDYNRDTGAFVWKIDVGCKIKAGTPAGHLNEDGYVQIQIDGKSYRAHRLAWLFEHGELPVMIDHINQDKSDNSISNLRSVSHSENMRNRKLSENNTSGVGGVTWCVRAKKWVARITVGGHRKHLGYFDDINMATKVRKNAKIKYGYCLNHN